jgi:hypothetical protein
VIWVDCAYVGSPPIESLRQQGHTIVLMVPGVEWSAATAAKPDLILHPAAHQWNDMMWDYLPAALVAARRRKKEAKR